MTCHVQKRWPINKGGGVAKGGAGGGDAYTVFKTTQQKEDAPERDCRVDGAVKAWHNKGFVCECACVCVACMCVCVSL